MLRMSSVDDDAFLPSSTRLECAAARPLRAPLPRARDAAVQEEVDAVHQPLERARLAQREYAVAALPARQRAWCPRRPNMTIGSWRRQPPLLEDLHQVRRLQGRRRAERTTRQSICCSRRALQIGSERSEAITSTSSGFRRAMIASRSAPGGMSSASLRRGRETVFLELRHRLVDDRLRRNRFGDEAIAPELIARSREVVGRHHAHGDVARRQVGLEAIQDPPALACRGRKMSSDTTEGWCSLIIDSAASPRCRSPGPEAALASAALEQHLGEG